MGKDPTLPTSLTIHFQAPTEAVVKQIEEALDSPEILALAEDPRLTSDGRVSEKELAQTLNWIPKGRLGSSARGIADFLEKLGGSDLIYQIESGRFAPSSR
ncbi:MAG: hypothetical protein ACC642_10640 [Pseudomonadales bacterium]